MQNSSFNFTLYRFTGPRANRSTEIVRDVTIADGMRTLISRDVISEAHTRVATWATQRGISVLPHEPYPSRKHPGMVWLEYRFCGLTL
jgi:hypothetical protein